MKGTDKFLVGIVAGALLLVAVVLGVLFTRPQVGFVSDDTPEGVVQNYLLALQQEDSSRAYGYISPKLRGYPDSVADFKRDLEFNSRIFYDDSSVTLEILSVEELGVGRAVVEVRETRFYSRGLFSSPSYDHTFDLYLTQVDSRWFISDGDMYFAHCWNVSGGCN